MLPFQMQFLYELYLVASAEETTVSDLKNYLIKEIDTCPLILVLHYELQQSYINSHKPS